jgi:hypothetical protein
MHPDPAMTPPADPDDACTWSPGSGDGQAAICERITAKLVVRGLKLGLDNNQDNDWLIAINMMASRKAMLVLLDHNGEPTDYDRQVTARVNDRVMAELVVSGLWYSPWIDVVEDEFPGIKFDQAKVDKFITEMPDEIERHDRIERISVLQPADMVAFLQENGYQIQQADVELVTSLCIANMAGQFMSAVIGETERQLDLADVFRPIFACASQPRHGIWLKFVEHFYLKEN